MRMLTMQTHCSALSEIAGADGNISLIHQPA
jgi:hypothetical protein